ncbi:MAG: DUF45 domain-containing protein [Bacteroidaceae bacterium]|nr:DUF45 domain-containing protein [Bacteroidaceae bacterium]
MHDEEFGHIHLVPSTRARRCVFRVADDGLLQVSVPPGATEADVRRALEQLRPRLRPFIKRVAVRRSAGSELVRQALAERGIADEMEALRQRLNPQLIRPDISPDQLRHLLLMAVLRQRAHRTFPSRLAELARQHGFSYRSLRINQSRTRWGSCSASGSINLSLWLALLPPHLQDYTMLHELCHTRHMDHSPQFWALLDSVCGGQNEALRREQAQWVLSAL